MNMTTKKDIEAFIEAVEENTTFEREELPVHVFERDEIHEATFESVHDFEGKFGPSTVAIITGQPGKVKTYFNGVERDCLKRFVESVELPVVAQFVRVLKDSQKNEGRTFGYLYIKEA